MKFSLLIYAKLIELVRQNPCLYDCSLPQNKNATLKNNVWTRIAELMGEETMTGEEWKKIWRQKRDAFMKKRREIQKCPASGSAARMQIAKMPLYGQLSFLVGHVTSRSTVNKLDEETQHNISDDETHLTADETTMSSYEGETSRSLSLTPTEGPRTDDCNTAASSGRNSSAKPFPASKKGKKRRLDSVIREIKDRSNINTEVERKLAEKGDTDTDDNIFFFIGRKFKNFSPSTKSWLEDEAMQLYMKAKRKDSVPVPVPVARPSQHTDDVSPSTPQSDNTTPMYSTNEQPNQMSQ